MILTIPIAIKLHETIGNTCILKTLYKKTFVGSEIISTMGIDVNCQQN
jgi:hypothetical protein